MRKLSALPEVRCSESYTRNRSVQSTIFPPLFANMFPLIIIVPEIIIIGGNRNNEGQMHADSIMTGFNHCPLCFEVFVILILNTDLIEGLTGLIRSYQIRSYQRVWYMNVMSPPITRALNSSWVDVREGAFLFACICVFQCTTLISDCYRSFLSPAVRPLSKLSIHELPPHTL